MGKPKSDIVIHGRRWFDKRYGNTYFSCRVHVDGETVVNIDYEYGYGDMYLQRAQEELFKQGRLPGMTKQEWGGLSPLLSIWARENGVKLIVDVADVARKKDL